MRRLNGMIIYSFFIVLLVALTVFLSGNGEKTGSSKSNQESSLTNLTRTLDLTNSSNVSLTELVKHSTKQDCWVSYKGKVYDITAFLPKHPGSATAIIPYCGKAKEFEDAFTGQHGTSQVNTLFKEGKYEGELE